MQIHFFIYYFRRKTKDGEQKTEKTNWMEKRAKSFCGFLLLVPQTTERKYADPLHVLVSRASLFSHCSVIPKVDNDMAQFSIICKSFDPFQMKSIRNDRLGMNFITEKKINSIQPIEQFSNLKSFFGNVDRYLTPALPLRHKSTCRRFT